MKALLSDIEPGRILEIRPDDEVFPVPETLRWIDCPDWINDQFVYNVETDEFEVQIPPSNINERYRIARQLAYGDVGEQLDMLYHELQSKGMITKTGPWSEHITNVKQTIRLDEV